MSDEDLYALVKSLRTQAARYDAAARVNRGNKHEARLAGGASALRRAADHLNALPLDVLPLLRGWTP